MSGSTPTSQAIRDVLSPFGTVHPQPSSDWNGDVALHHSLIRFYEEMGPCGAAGPHGPDRLSIPTTGNPFEMAPLARLWDRQAGYRPDRWCRGGQLSTPVNGGMAGVSTRQRRAGGNA